MRLSVAIPKLQAPPGAAFVAESFTASTRIGIQYGWAIKRPGQVQSVLEILLGETGHSMVVDAAWTRTAQVMEALREKEGLIALIEESAAGECPILDYTLAPPADLDDIVQRL